MGQQQQSTTKAVENTQSKLEQTTRRRPALWILAFMASIGPFGDTEYVPSLPSIAKHFSVPYSQVILTMTAYLIAYAISQLFYGPISDRYGRRPVILGGSLAFISGSVICLCSVSLNQLIVGRFIQALGACAGTIISFASVRDAFPIKDQAATYAKVNAAFTIAPALGPMIGALVDQLFGWRANFTVLLIMSCLFLTAVYFYYPETNHHPNPLALQAKTIMKNYLSLFKHPTYTYYLTIIGLCIGIVYNCLTEAPSLLIIIMHLSTKIFIVVALGVMLGFICGSLTSAYLSKRLAPTKIILIGILVILSSAAALATVVYLQKMTALSVLIPIDCLFVGIAMVLPISTASALAPFGHIAGSASAMLGFFQMSFASLSTGALSVFHTTSAYTLALSAAILGSAALLVLLTTIMWRKHGTELN